MVVPKLRPEEVAYFARLIVDEDQYEEMNPSDRILVESACLVAEGFAKSYTGLPMEDEVDEDTDNNEALRYAMKCIAAESLDLRNVSWDYNNTNPMVRAVLNLYTGTHLPEVE